VKGVVLYGTTHTTADRAGTVKLALAASQAA
jgi:hypothetical protein